MPTSTATTNSEKHDASSSSYDIIIVGAGLSGVNAAYRVQEGLPHMSYAIFEARDVIGGTWSFFKYPGIRSDSEIASFAFSWAPWDSDTNIAEGSSILKYLETTAAKHGIDKKIQFNTKVTHLDWQSDIQRWRLTTTVNNNNNNNNDHIPQIVHARFVILGTGYYDYTTPQHAAIPGLDNFSGTTIHPQFWPSDFDAAGKNIVIIGSGATAATLVPALSKTAAHVTMVQRSPSYYLLLPTVEKVDVLLKKILPATWAYQLIRLRILITGFLFVQFCYKFPNAAAKVLRSAVKDELGPDYVMDPHFQPKYRPFEQRICITPDGDFFAALREKKAHLITGEVDTMKDRSIMLKSGEIIEDVDVVITATGLKLHLIGGIQPLVDGEPVDIASKFTWNNTALQDMPNVCFMLGYIDNAWTLGSDSSCRLFVRMVKQLEKRGCTSFVPTITDEEKKDLVEVPMLNVSSGYLVRTAHMLPRTASTAPWKPRWHYFQDWWFAGHGNIDKGMKWVKGKI